MKRQKQLYAIERNNGEFLTDVNMWGKKEQAALYTYEEASEMVSKVEAEQQVFCESFPIEEEVEQYAFEFSNGGIVSVPALSPKHAATRLGALLILAGEVTPLGPIL